MTMPAPLIPKEEVLDRLTRVFREVGYEAATLSRLSLATGLVKASLYHYFPGGKEDMAGAVLARANTWLEKRVLEPLAGPGLPAERLNAMARELDVYYAGGREGCLLGLLSQGDARDLFQSHVRSALERWVTAIAAVLEEAGLPADIAVQRGQDAVIQVQGALVVSRGLNSTEPFSRTVLELPTRLLAPVFSSRPNNRRLQ
jgi:TetR/AcrR family transcriptional regulator, lmrAB and yxaGH operons repressor